MTDSVWRSKRLLLASLALVTLGLSGCDRGVELAEVTGQVYLDGQPLANASLEFQPAGGSPSYGQTDTSGVYVLQFTRDRGGAMPGAHTVSIRTEGTVVNAEGHEQRVREKLPPKYNDESELVRDVTSGSNQIDFQLQSDPKFARRQTRRR